MSTQGQASESPAPEGLRLQSGSPDALCPDLVRTRAAVRRRLGAIRAEALEGWIARYTLGHDPELEPRDFVRLELFAPTGQRELSRDLPIEGSCSTLSDAIALILDRHFRGLSASAVPPAFPALASLQSVRDEASAVATGGASRQRERWLGLEGSWDPGRGAWALGVRWLGRWRSGFRLGASVSGQMSERTEVLGDPPQGRVEASEVQLELLAGWGGRLGPGRWLLAPVMTGGVDFARGVGLSGAARGRRAMLGLGARSGLAWDWTADSSISSFVSVGWSATIWAGELHVDSQPVLEPARHRFSLALATGYAW